jgi:hypothetical protein
MVQRKELPEIVKIWKDISLLPTFIRVPFKSGHMTMPASNKLPRISIWICCGTRFFAQSIPFTRRSRPLIGLEYFGASEHRLFLFPTSGRNSIERAEVPRLVVLRLR